MTTLDDVGAVFGEPSAKTGSIPINVWLILGAVLLLVGLVAGAFWWYSRQDGETKALTTSDSGPTNQQTSKVSGQPSTPDGAGTVSPSTSGNLWAVIPGETSGTINAANALGAANQQFAVIKPGGQLALDYREGQFFGNGDGPDLRVYGPEAARVSYLIFVRDSPAEAWRRIDINRKGFPQGTAGHDMGHHGVLRGHQIMIRNNGNTDLNIDAISAVYKDKAPVASTHQRH